jgi:hypothetical protein
MYNSVQSPLYQHSEANSVERRNLAAHIVAYVYAVSSNHSEQRSVKKYTEVVKRFSIRTVYICKAVLIRFTRKTVLI